MPSSYAQAQLGLARAYAMAGDKANAKKAYEAFLLTWKRRGPRFAHAGGGEEGVRCTVIYNSKSEIFLAADAIHSGDRVQAKTP